MQMIRGRAQNRIHRLLLFQHFAEILIFRAAIIWGLLGVMFFDVGLDWLPPSRAAIIEFAVVGLLAWIANSDDLRLRFTQQRAHIRLALSAGADDGDIHFFARRHEFGAA